MVNYLFYIGVSIVLFLPAFISNPAAVLTGGGTRMDFGRKFPDGRRILGDGKSWRGFFGGSLTGAVLGVLIYIPLDLALVFPGSFSSNLPYVVGISLSLSFGSLSGDATGSFIKRRLGMKSGQNAFLLDQIPFVLVAFLFLYVYSPPFFMSYYGNVIGAVTILVLTPPLHRAINILGYRINRKDVPW